MRCFQILIFILLMLNTEGVCQNSEIPLVDTTYQETPNVDDVDEDAYTQPSKSRFEDAVKKYHQEDIPKKDFDKNNWKKATEGLDYTVEKEKKAKARTQSPNLRMAPAFITFMKWFFVLGAAFILAFLIYQFVGEGNVFGRKSRRLDAPSVEIDLKRIEDDLQNVELDPLIKQAIAQKQFALAIRLYYLATIKELSLSKAIVWKKDKTNREYTREMRVNPLFDSFKSTTHIFERIWYGDAPLDEANFTLIQPAFQDLLNQSKKK